MFIGYRKLLLAILILVAIVILAFGEKLTEWVAISLGTLKALFDFSNGHEHYTNYKRAQIEVERNVKSLSDNDLARRATHRLE